MILACTQTAENAGMVDDAFLDAARDGCVLVNVARGGLFQPDARPARARRQNENENEKTKKLAFVASDVAWEEPADPTHPLIAHARRVLHTARGRRHGRLVPAHGPGRV